MATTAKELLDLDLGGNCTLEDAIYAALDTGNFDIDPLRTDSAVAAFCESVAQKLIDAVTKEK